MQQSFCMRRSCVINRPIGSIYGVAAAAY